MRLNSWVKGMCHFALTLPISTLLICAAHSQSNNTATKVSAPHAEWSTLVATVLSVPSKDAFNEAGLNKLTPEELRTLMSDAGYMPRVEYRCGPDRHEAKAFDTIFALVHFSSGTPIEIQSTILQKLRNISDLRLVYERKEADIKVEFLGLEAKATNQSRLGFTLSMVVTEACSFAIGKSSDTPVDDLEDFQIFSGANVEEVATPAAAALDAGEFERARKSNASFKKFFQPKE
jgi:hypothetical protein